MVVSFRSNDTTLGRKQIGERKRIIMCQPFFDHRGNRHPSELPSSRSHHLPLRSQSPCLAWLLIAPCCLEGISNPARADGTVTTCDQASLEATLAGGGNVTFACSGVIVLTNTITITTDHCPGWKRAVGDHQRKRSGAAL